MCTGDDQDAVVAHMNEVEHRTKGDECLTTLSLPSQQETQNESGKATRCLLTDDVIELADATDISSIFDCMDVVEEETTDVIGAMNIRSSLPNNPNQEETSIQPSSSYHGHFVKPAPTPSSQDLKAPVCLPDDSGFRMPPHSSTSTSATCRVCLATFETKSQMFRHIRKDHRGFKKDVTKGRETLSSAPTSRTVQSKNEGEAKQEPNTAQEPLTNIDERDIMCEQTGRTCKKSPSLAYLRICKVY